MAVACCEKLTADERIEHSNLQIAASSMILIWSFSDPINPQASEDGLIDSLFATQKKIYEKCARR